MMLNAERDRPATELARREEREATERARREEREAEELRFQRWVEAQQQPDRRAGGRDQNPQEKVPKYKGMEKGADISTFFVGFEAHMRNYEVDQGRWHKLLVLSLNEEAIEAYGRAPADSQRNYGLLKKHLLKEFHVTKDTYRRRLENLKKEQTESWATVADRIQNLSRRWWEECRENIFKHKLMLERLKNSIPIYTKHVKYSVKNY